MANKFNNKTLLIVLAALVVLYFGSQFLQKRSRAKTTLKTDIVQIDTAAITSFIIDKDNKVEFKRNGNTWQVSSNGVTDEADPGVVNNMLAQLLAIKAERLVSNSSEKWGEYQLTDSAATRVQVTENNSDQTLDLYIGRFQYQPPPQNQQNQFQQRQPQITGSTYIRLGEGDAVYSTEGFLTMAFGQEFNTWREGKFIQTVKSNIKRIQFDYPADSSFTLAKVDSLWAVDGVVGNQDEIESYLDNLVYKQDKTFVDDFQPAGTPSHAITIAGDNMADVKVTVYADYENDAFYMQSNQNQGATIKSIRRGLFESLVVDKARFLTE